MTWIKHGIIFALLLTVCFSQEQSESTEDDEVDFTKLNNGIGLAYHSHSPCQDDNFIFMGREAARPAPVEKYWDGSLGLENYKNITSAPLTVLLTLDNPASVYVNPKDGTARNIRWNTFEIKPIGLPPSIKFTVQGPPDTPFPEVKEVVLNGVRICKKIVKWNPTIYGKSNQAVANPILPKDFVLPFCGRKILDHTALLTKGTPTKPGDWPWHVALLLHPTRNVSTYICGGSIITTNYIITAAHCVTERRNKIPPSKLSVLLGKYNLKRVESYAFVMPISQVIVHDGFDRVKFTNDIALLKTAQPIQYTDYIQPICMWNKFNTDKESIWGQRATAVGWGTTENDVLSPVIQLGSMTIISNTTCLLSYPDFYKRYVRPTTFCAGSGNGTSVCNGDSGGGLLIPITFRDDKTTWFLRGIVSLSVSRHDRNLCDPNHYAIFTDVAEYLDWIEYQTAN